MHSRRTFRVFLAILMLGWASLVQAALRPDDLNLEARLFGIKLLRFNPTDKLDLLEQYFRKNIANYRELVGAFFETVAHNHSKVLRDFRPERRKALLRNWMNDLEKDHPDLSPRLDAARLFLSWRHLADQREALSEEAAEELRKEAREALDGLDVSGWTFLVAGLVVDLVGPGEGDEALAPTLQLWEKASELGGSQDAHLHFLLGELLTQVLDPAEPPVYCKRIATEFEKSLLVSPSDKQLYSAVAGRYHEIYETLSSKEAQLPFWFEELVFKRLIAVEPTNARAHNNLSFLYSQYGVNLKDALKEAQIANQLMPGDPNMLDTLGWAYYKAGNPEKAIQVLTRALELDDSLADVHFHLATILYDLKELDKAVEHFRATVALDPENAFALNNLAYLFSERGTNLKEGLELVQQALALQPENSAFLDTRGWLFYRLGNYEEADAHVSRAIELQPEVSELHLHKGQIALARGRYQVATDNFEKALTYEPKNQELARLLARIYALNGIRQGLARFSRIHSVQKKDNFEVFYRAMAEVYQVDGLYQEAIETLERFRTLPESAAPPPSPGTYLPQDVELAPDLPVGADFPSAVKRLSEQTDMVVTVERAGLVTLLDLVIDTVKLPFPLAPFRDHILPHLPFRVALGFDAASAEGEEHGGNIALVQFESEKLEGFAARLAQLGETAVQVPGAPGKILLSSWSYKDKQLGSVGVPGMMFHYLVLDGALAFSQRKSTLLEMVDNPPQDGPAFSRKDAFQDFLPHLEAGSHVVLVGHMPPLVSGKAGEKLSEEERTFLQDIELICSQYVLGDSRDVLLENSRVYPRKGRTLTDAAQQAEVFARRSIARFPASERLEVAASFGLEDEKIRGQIQIQGIKAWARELLQRLGSLGIDLPDLQGVPEEPGIEEEEPEEEEDGELEQLEGEPSSDFDEEPEEDDPGPIPVPGVPDRQTPGTTPEGP